MSHGQQTKRKRQAILDALSTAETPLVGRAIADRIEATGLDISERSVRLYLRELEAQGLTLSNGRRGHVLTDLGKSEQSSARVVERLGSVASRIDRLTFRMSFDLELRAGTVAVNTALVSPEALLSRLPLICQVFERKYSMGNLVAVLAPGERVGEVVVPENTIGLCTVCSITLNGILLKHGVPTRSLFSGLLDLEGGRAVRFSELIDYDGTTLDPLELFIRGGMTNYLGAVTRGTGRIGAGFREVPAESHDLVVSLADRADRIGLGGFLQIGHPDQALFNIPVRQGCCGAVVIGGLNPMAILEETGERILLRAMSGLMDFHRLFPYDELEPRVRALF